MLCPGWWTLGNKKMQDRENKTLTGVVVSNSGDKSRRVVIDYKVKHPKYGKYVARRITFMVHDEHNQAGVGDLVRLAKSRPDSKMKSWRLLNILKKAEEK